MMAEPINTAICSYGMSGRLFHAPFIVTNPLFRLTGVWERSGNNAVENYPFIKTYRSLESLLSDKEVELVIVNTPNITHYDYVKHSLLAGKHVIVEKPFCVTVEEGKELIQIAEQHGLKLSVYHNRRFDSDYKTVRRILQENRLGDLVEAEIHYDRFVKELSYKTHKEKGDKGTGGLYDLGSHLIDQALQLFGKPKGIFADLRIIRPKSKVDDYFEVIFFYPSLRVKLKSSYLVREALPGYIIHGSMGSFIKPKTNIQEIALNEGILPEQSDWGEEPESEWGLLHTEENGRVIKEYIASEKGNYGDYYDGIYKSIRNNAPLPVTANDGLDVIKVIEACFKSHEGKRIIDIQF